MPSCQAVAGSFLTCRVPPGPQSAVEALQSLQPAVAQLQSLQGECAPLPSPGPQAAYSSWTLPPSPLTPVEQAAQVSVGQTQLPLGGGAGAGRIKASHEAQGKRTGPAGVSRASQTVSFQGEEAGGAQQGEAVYWGADRAGDRRGGPARMARSAGEDLGPDHAHGWLTREEEMEVMSRKFHEQQAWHKQLR